MDLEKRRSVALGRYSIVTTLKNLKETFPNEARLFVYGAGIPYEVDGIVQRPVSSSTIRRWYKAYEKGGFDALMPEPRKDKGEFRKLDNSLKQTIANYIEKKPDITSTAIFSELSKEGEIMDGEVSLSTVTRFAGTVKSALPDNPEDIRRYELINRNDVWYGDTMHACHLKIDGKEQKIYIMILIDDYSRMVVGHRACLNDDKYNLHFMMGEAVTKYGIPDLFVFDNGSNYRSKSVQLLAARMGTSVHYCRPYTPRQKGKIERFNRTLRDQFLATLDLEAVHDLKSFNLALTAYIKKYNSSIHSSIQDTPINRFFSDSKPIHRIDSDRLDDYLLIEDTRKVTTDRIIQVNNIEYEVPAEYSRRKVTILENPERTRVWIQREKDRIEVFKVDKNENALSGRRIKMSKLQNPADETAGTDYESASGSDSDQREENE